MTITIPAAEKMHVVFNGNKFEVKQNGNRFYYFSRLNARWMPIAKAQVIFG